MENYYQIISNGKTFNSSKYQVEIFKTIEKGVNNLIINASAGSSKTTTIVNSLRFIPNNKKILFIAFNKDIVEKLKTEVTHENCNISTFHSLGMSFLVENKIFEKSQYLESSNKILDINKYNNYIYNNITSITRYGEVESLGRDYRQYIKNIQKLVDYSRYYLAFTCKEIEKVSKIYGINKLRDEYEVVREILIWGKSNINLIDYTDMVWLPNVLNLTTKKNLFDWIFIDESQDTSIVEQKLIEKCFKRNTKFVATGDEFQQINVWAGSSEDAIENFKKHPNTIELSLPISYRCPKKIVELASKYSNNIIANDDSIDGDIRYNVSIFEPVNGDMVLCRMTSPLVKLYLEYIKHGKKSYIRGYENIKENYLSIINQFNSILIDRNCMTSDGLFPQMYKLLFDRIKKMQLNYNFDEVECLKHPSIIDLYDSINGIFSISEGLIETKDLISKLETVFVGDKEESIELSTIHKSKGLESNNVYILCPSLMPSSFATMDWEKKSENNLIYVAYTRAKNSLSFMREDSYSSFLSKFSNTNSLKKTLEKIKDKINFNDSLLIREKNIDVVEEDRKQLIKIGENKDINKKMFNKKNKNKLLNLLN